jgi:hypothetical protein
VCLMARMPRPVNIKTMSRTMSNTADRTMRAPHPIATQTRGCRPFLGGSAGAGAAGGVGGLSIRGPLSGI